jgi:cytochrome bd-type quinol oxidase subunit 2
MNLEWYFYGIIIVVGIMLLRNTYLDFKNTEKEKRGNKALIYGCVIASLAIVYIALRTYAAEPLSDLYFKLAKLGTT